MSHISAQHHRSESAPCIVVSGPGDTSIDQDSLSLDEHVLTRGEDRSVGNHDVLDDMRIGEDDKALVSDRV